MDSHLAWTVAIMQLYDKTFAFFCRCDCMQVAGLLAATIAAEPVIFNEMICLM